MIRLIYLALTGRLGAYLEAERQHEALHDDMGFIR